MTREPRIAVTLPTEAREAITVIARSQHTSRSKVAAEVILAALPVLTRVAATLQNLAQIEATKKDSIRRTVDAALADAEQHALAAQSLLEKIDAAAEEARADARSAPPSPTSRRRPPAPPSV